MPSVLHVPSVPPESNVRFQVRDDTGRTVFGLLRDGLEEEVHGLAEALLHAWGGGGNGSSPEAAGGN